MSQSSIVRRKSSPCCIGCVVGLVIGLGFLAATGIFMYRFAKDSITLVQVAGKNDPELSTVPEVLFPETVGDFQRVSLTDSLESVPDLVDVQSSSAQVAVYEDGTTNSITVIAMSTAEARAQREQGFGLLTLGRGKANASDTGISIRDPFSGDVPRTVVTWEKPNWTFMVQTTSSLAVKFVEDFEPGGVSLIQAGDDITTETEGVGSGETANQTVEVTQTETQYN